MSGGKLSTLAVLCFYPNIIGMARVVLALASFYYMSSAPYLAMLLYWLSAFLDAFDGMAARRYDQCTKFGAVLDMVSDRCTTLALMVMLGSFYPKHILFFQLIITLDIGSHWVQMYSSLAKGSVSHKSIDASANPILRIYYESKTVLFMLCAFNETFCMGAYLMHFSPGPAVLVPGLGEFGLWELMFYISAPFFAIKHAISVVQLVYACGNIIQIDIAERASRKR